jgi:hypothetical protein
MADTPNDKDMTRVHERLDLLFGELAEVKTALVKIAEGCGPCKEAFRKHEAAIYGNGDGRPGILTRLETTVAGRVDTLSVKSVCVLLAAVGTLAATIGGAMAALVK